MGVSEGGFLILGGVWVSTTFEVDAEAIGKGEPQMIEQALLPGIRAADTSQPEGAGIGSLQQEVAAPS